MTSPAAPEVPVSPSVNLDDMAPEAERKRAFAGMTPEQREQLRMELDAAEEGGEAKADPDRYVYSNLEDSQQLIPDLGFGKGRNFSPFVFQPHEIRDLSKSFRKREIDRSHYLGEACRIGSLKRGRATPEELKKSQDPLAVAARAAGPLDQIHDPMAGKREYDLKLAEVKRSGPGGTLEEESTRRT